MTDQATLGPIIGSQIGNWRVLRELGSGAMGEVFLAEHPQIGSKVAVKVLAPHLSANPDMGKRFMSEAKAANRINHPNIIQIFDFGRLEDGRLYLVMEYLSGQELTEHLKAHAPLPVGEVTELLRQITSAMGAAHEAGIVHRDLKPDNIFLHEAGGERVVKILDFGIAKLTEGALGGGHKTATGVIMGTPLYMSPEQAAGQVDEIAAQSDIYSIGVILYQMLSGSLPIQGATAAQILASHIAESPIPLDRAVSGLPAAVVQVVARCLEKQPQDRYACAADLYRAFAEAIAGLPADLRAQPVLEGGSGTGTVAYESQPGAPFGGSRSGASSVAAGTGLARVGTASAASAPPGAGSEPATVAARPGAHGGAAPAATESLGARSEPGLGSGGQPTTLRSAAGESLAGGVPAAAGRGRGRLVAAVLGGGVLVAGGIFLVLHLSRGDREGHNGAQASAHSAKSDPAARPPEHPATRPPEHPPEGVRPMEPGPPRPRTVTVRVTCRTQGAEVFAQVGKAKPQRKRAPFTLQVPAGTRVDLTARRRGYRARRETLVVRQDASVDLSLTQRLRRRHYRRRGVPRPPRRRGRRVGEGTLHLD